MKVGFDGYINIDNGLDIEFLKDAVTAIEELGYATLWVGDHVVLPTEGLDAYPHGAGAKKFLRSIRGLMDPIPLLAAISAMTTRLRIGTGVLLLGERNPLVIAHELATLDCVSGGRLDLGIGLGWWREEYEALGVSWKNRGRRVDEYIEVIKALWAEDVASYSGHFVTFRKVRSYPKPVQTPHPRMYIGGNGEATIRRIARHNHTGWYGSQVSIAAMLSFVDSLQESLEGVGRTIEDVALKVARPTPSQDKAGWGSDREYLEKCERLGIDEVVLRPGIPADSEFASTMQSYADEIGLSRWAAI